LKTIQINEYENYFACKKAEWNLEYKSRVEDQDRGMTHISETSETKMESMYLALLIRISGAYVQLGLVQAVVHYHRISECPENFEDIPRFLWLQHLLTRTLPVFIVAMIIATLLGSFFHRHCPDVATGWGCIEALTK
jgi:hypothetical protein